MIKNYVVILALPVILFACSKSESTESTQNNCTDTGGVPTAAEITNVQNYLTSKGIVAMQDSRGFFYEILGTGYGASSPSVASTVTVKYKGTLPNGTIFDSTATGATATFPLNRVILGWQYGVPLIRKAGVVNLYLPPSLGYGCNGAGSSIPPNSILIFRVELVNY